MEYIDLILAILHHLLVFALAAIIAMESLLVRQNLSHGTISLLARIDRHYGMIAGAVILIGIGRVLFGLRGWEYYVYYWAFWAKMAAFAGVGLLSIQPTMHILAWSRAAAKDNAFRVPTTELAAVQRYVRAEVVVFLLIPIFAAIMARGVGY